MGLLTIPTSLVSQVLPIDEKTQQFSQPVQSLFLSLLTRTGGQSGAPNILLAQTVAVAATYDIVGDWTEFTSVGAGGIAQIPTLNAGNNFNVGSDFIIQNSGGANLSVKPPPTMQIDALGLGVGYALITAKMQWYRVWSTTQIYSMQLG